ncbi:MAG TPA: helix-turn-helix domain-containing protein, partial [Ktedonobacterales bacterium]
ADLRGKQRDRRIVLPRHIAMYLMHQETDASSTDIGNELGGRDHTTAIHGYEKIAEDIKNNPTLKREIEAIRQMLYNR